MILRTALLMMIMMQTPGSSFDDRTQPLRAAIEADDVNAATGLIDEMRSAGQPLPALDDGGTMLHLAAVKSSAEMVRMLVDRGLEIEATDSLGRTPLHVAHSLTAEALVSAGADFVATDRLGNLPLHYAAEKGGAHCQLFVDKGVPVDARNNAGLTPLHFATLYGEMTSVTYLLDRGADINARTLAEYRYLPWWFDPQSNQPRTVPPGTTPLDITSMMHKETKWSSGRHRAILALLTERGAQHGAVRLHLSPLRIVTLFGSGLLFLLVFFWVLLQIDARMTGWHALAERFPAAHTPAMIKKGQDGDVGRIGLVRLKGLFHAAATDDGLYLAVPSLVRAGHPPLLVPWGELSIAKESTIAGIEVLELRVSRADGELIVLRGGIVPQVRERLRQQTK